MSSVTKSRRRTPVTKYDYEGNEISYTENSLEDGYRGITAAVPFGDGYMIMLDKWDAPGDSELLVLGASGAVSDLWNYSSETEVYFITDAVPFAGNVYLSAYVLQKREEEITSRHEEVMPVLQYIWGTDGLWEKLDDNYEKHYDTKKELLYMEENEQISRMVRELYQAVLLVCDSVSGEPKRFYTVDGSVGMKLSVSDNKASLVWNVESITDVFYSHSSSAYSLLGDAYVYRYSFDKDGTLLRREDTGEVERFAR